MKLTRAMMAGLLEANALMPEYGDSVEFSSLPAHLRRIARRQRWLVLSDCESWVFISDMGRGAIAACRALGHTAASLREGE